MATTSPERTRAFIRTGRLAIVGLLIMAALVGLTARLYDLQVLRGESYLALSEQNRVLRLPVPAERGLIVDRNGVVLARNLPGFGVTVVPVEVPRAQAPALAERLGTLLDRDPKDVLRDINTQRLRNAHEAVTVSPRPIDRELALLIAERADQLPGVRIVAETIRHYVDGPLYAPLLGYTGPITEPELATRREAGYLPQSHIGRTGLERVYERFLRGAYGWREIERDAAQRELRELALAPPTRGSDLVLTLDDRLQRIIAAELTRGIEEERYTQAVGVAMDPKTGDLLAMVTVPGYDNNLFVRGISRAEMAALNADPRRPLVNKAMAEIYPPGSTYKAVTGLAALQEGIAHRGTSLHVGSNVMTVGGFNFYDWRAHGTVNFIDGFAYSSNIYFYTLGGGNPNTGRPGVGPEKLTEHARAMGFGAPTGVDLPGEALGILPDPRWKEATLGERWTIGNTYHASIGQGYVAVTPLQLLNAYAAIANGGTLHRPRFLKEVRAHDGAPVPVERPGPHRTLPIDPEHLHLIRAGSRKVVTSGMAFMRDPKVVVAGKTGTAEHGLPIVNSATGRVILPFHNWFVSWVPKGDESGTDTDIAMVIFTFNSSQSACASCVSPAVTTTQRIYEIYFGHTEP